MNCSAGETMKQLNKKSLRHQVGASKFGLLMIFILLAVFFTFGLKVVPLYVDHNLVTGICKKLIENGEAENMTVNYIRQRVLNTLRINNITDLISLVSPYVKRAIKPLSRLPTSIGST